MIHHRRKKNLKKRVDKCEWMKYYCNIFSIT